MSDDRLHAALQWHANGLRAAPDAPSVQHVTALLYHIRELRRATGLPPLILPTPMEKPDASR
jgi:hypothetical protein